MFQTKFRSVRASLILGCAALALVSNEVWTYATDSQPGRAAPPEVEEPTPRAGGAKFVAPSPGAYSFAWILEGVEVGRTDITVTLRAPAGESKSERELVMESAWRFERDGSRLSHQGTTVFDLSNGSPKSYQVTSKGATTSGPSYEAVRRLEAAFTKETMRTRVFDGEKKLVREDVVSLPSEFLIWGDQAFEHWPLLAAVLHAKGSCHLQLARPHLSDVVDFDFKRGELVKTDAGPLWKWSVDCRFFQATLWLREDGQLHKYQQDRLEIVTVPKVAPSPPLTPPTPPQSEPGAKPGDKRPR
ncbi:MAG: hypothetical protein ACKVX7_01270 [Planctomycetota bacterium]